MTMNCPSCSQPLLFGATSCPCGYNRADSPDGLLPIELTYLESLRAFWRIYWPTQLVGIAFGVALAMASPAAVRSAGLGLLLFQAVLTGLALFFFVPRICSRPYQGFSLVVIETATGETAVELSDRPQWQVFVFIWWRQLLAGMFAGLLAMPLNVLLSLMGLHVTQWITAIAGVIVIGPIIVKMLIGHQFESFRLEARRDGAGRSAAAASGN